MFVFVYACVCESVFVCTLRECALERASLLLLAGLWQVYAGGGEGWQVWVCGRAWQKCVRLKKLRICCWQGECKVGVQGAWVGAWVREWVGWYGAC